MTAADQVDVCVALVATSAHYKVLQARSPRRSGLTRLRALLVLACGVQAPAGLVTKSACDLEGNEVHFQNKLCQSHCEYCVDSVHYVQVLSVLLAQFWRLLWQQVWLWQQAVES